MDFYKRKSVSDNLKKYLFTAKEHDFIEITEWENGEGWDISINDHMIQLHRDELGAIVYLTKALDYEEEV